MKTSDYLVAAKALKLDGGEGSGVRGHTTEKALHYVTVTGNTYPVRDQLKAKGFSYDATRKAWDKSVIHSVGLVGPGHPDDSDVHKAERVEMNKRGDLPAFKGTAVSTILASNYRSNSEKYPDGHQFAGKYIHIDPGTSRFIQGGVESGGRLTRPFYDKS